MPLRANTSGSFVKGNFAGRFFAPIGFARDITAEAASFSLSGSSDVVASSGISSPSCSYHAGPRRGKIGAAPGIMLGYMDTYYGDNGWTRTLQSGVTKNLTDGTLSDPCLQLNEPGFWRFRWAVKNGLRNLTVQAKQNSTGSYRPSVILRKNPSIGVLNDVSASAADGAGWTTIGPITINPTVTGYVWVELWNNNVYWPILSGDTFPCYFDHIVTT